MNHTQLKFCEVEEWHDVIRASQHSLFDVEYLIDCGAQLREMYYGDRPPKGILPEVSDLTFDQGGEFVNACSGFDMPISITPENWNGKFIVFIAQDALRKPTLKAGNRLSIGAPWNFVEASFREKRIYGVLWRIIEEICAAGHGVWVTDAFKLYAHCSSGIKKTKETEMLEQKTIIDEIHSLKPEHIVAFGNDAQGVLKEANILFDAHPHPSGNARSAQRKHYGIESATNAALEAAIKRQICEKSGLAI